jgi:hypothetical protein
MKSDALKPRNSFAAPPNQLPKRVHCLIVSQGRGPDYLSTLSYLSLFEEVHHV